MANPVREMNIAPPTRAAFRFLDDLQANESVVVRVTPRGVFSLRASISYRQYRDGKRFATKSATQGQVRIWRTL